MAISHFHLLSAKTLVITDFPLSFSPIIQPVNKFYLLYLKKYILNSLSSHHFHYYHLGPSHLLLLLDYYNFPTVTLLPCLPLLGLFSKAARKILLKYKTDDFIPMFNKVLKNYGYDSQRNRKEFWAKVSFL